MGWIDDMATADATGPDIRTDDFSTAPLYGPAVGILGGGAATLGGVLGAGSVSSPGGMIGTGNNNGGVEAGYSGGVNNPAPFFGNPAWLAGLADFTSALKGNSFFSGRSNIDFGQAVSSATGAPVAGVPNSNVVSPVQLPHINLQGAMPFILTVGLLYLAFMVVRKALH